MGKEECAQGSRHFLLLILFYLFSPSWHQVFELCITFDWRHRDDRHATSPPLRRPRLGPTRRRGSLTGNGKTSVDIGHEVYTASKPMKANGLVLTYNEPRSVLVTAEGSSVQVQSTASDQRERQERRKGKAVVTALAVEDSEERGAYLYVASSDGEVEVFDLCASKRLAFVALLVQTMEADTSPKM